MPNKEPKPRSDQLTLDLTCAPRFGAEDFLISKSNEHAYAMIELWPDWPDPILILLGAAGTGKSHLAAIWAARSEAKAVEADALGALDLPALTLNKALLIEGGERLRAHEAALFHLSNLVRAQGMNLLITAREAPETWGLATADLISRLRLAPRVTIGAPDDALIRAVLVKLLVDRQLIVDTNVVEYAARRLNRGLDAACDFVAALDREAMARGRRVTRTMASEVLQVLRIDDDELRDAIGDQDGEKPDGSHGGL